MILELFTRLQTELKKILTFLELQVDALTHVQIFQFKLSHMHSCADNLLTKCEHVVVHKSLQHLLEHTLLMGFLKQKVS